MTKLVLKTALLAATFALSGTALIEAANKPKTVVHVINVRFKPDASKEAIDKAIAAIGDMKYPGVKNVWLKPIQVQGGDSKFTHCLVMEFESAESLKKYAGSEAQKEFYKYWLPVRDLSNTHDVTN